MSSVKIEIVDLDQEVENTRFTVDIYKNDNIVYISTEDTGCSYDYETKEDIITAVTNYIKDYVEV
jgi:sensor histidine kinase YesM